MSGARMMHNYIRIGGVKNDLPDDFSQHMARLIPEIKQGIDEADRLLSFSEIFLARTKGIGVIDAKTAIANGMSGPCLRATGVPMDVRKDEPYSVYDRFDFGIPIGEKGDCWDRFYVRVEEMRQSLRIIEQAMAQIEAGPVSVPVRIVLRPPEGEVYARAEKPPGRDRRVPGEQGRRQALPREGAPPVFLQPYVPEAPAQGLLRGRLRGDSRLLDVVLGEVDR